MSDSTLNSNSPAIPSPTKPELLRALEFHLGSSFSVDPITPPPNPLIIVISGASGVGKDAVINKLREARESLHFVVTATSRPMRPGEIDGRDYFFVSKDEFLSMVEKDELLEHALVYGDYKGIPKKQIQDFMAKGCDIVLRVDVQGAQTLRKILGNSAVFVFLVAESELAMVERLVDRRTESHEELLVRVTTAREEIRHVKDFDYVVVNAKGKLEDSVKRVESIIDAEKSKVSELHKLEEARGSNDTVFDLRSSIEKGDSGETADAASVSSATAFRRKSTVPAPEKKLTLFALKLAILEKTATGIGTLGFIWATVVLLGGFAITLDGSDFWFITIILLIEGARIFSRSHELEWQHQATWTVAGVGLSSFRALRSSSASLLRNLKQISASIFMPILGNRSREATTSRDCVARESTFDETWNNNSDVPLLPYARWFFISSTVSRFLYWLQLMSATACVALSLYKLVKHDYGDVHKGDTDKRNRQSALNIFYSLALAEAMLFLMEKAYWEWQVSVCNLLENVTRECEFGVTGLVSIKRFFYDSYSKCVNGSIFDGLKMDIVSFGMELLGSNSSDEQLIGARILRQFSVNERYSEDTLEKIGINFPVVERLVEMLNWKDLQEEEIRRSAAEILSKLAGKKQNSLRVAGISGAMESISSLLESTRSSGEAPDEIGEKKVFHDHNLHYDFYRFNNLGLLLLKKLAKDHDNCGKLGNTRGLLPKIIDFTHVDQAVLRDDNADVARSQVLTLKRSLQLVKMLASTTGNTGKCLRREISEIVFTVSNVRDVLRHGERYPKLQKLGIGILTNLALEAEARERIGGTGGVLKELFNIFLKQDTDRDDHGGEGGVRIAAGEAIAMLVLESKSNCLHVLRLGVTGRLVEALEVPSIRVNAARVLRNLCLFSGDECFHDLKFVKAAAPTVLKSITSEDNKLQEVMVGLAAQVFRFMSAEDSSYVFMDSGVKRKELANSLVSILRKHDKPAIKVPRIRRFAIELAVWMMEDDVENNVAVFRELGLEKELEKVLETTAELENFDVFSGTVGVSRHSRTVHSLAELALKILES
ncbi:unnamed protein product [Microthlaspi erraticum]|uniref:guanylate kinase n=1 Tax=Microthlaspi erraticum TaxID=1685480 RepID=A0A6D2KY31_9BRAS|nr:unnamed protein product [Microthlaspi erraticum]